MGIILVFLGTAYFLLAPLRQKSAYALPAIGLMGRAASPAGAANSQIKAEPAELTRFGLIFALT